ncbi:MAG: pyridoxal phosphate-dependent aminotransferase [Candidatus Heimdallarchaeota archaeon]|nr:pyridoxal phosphate-dependent aminotransferase [Candidatus Heimdallarchaeota archaeon]
MNVINLEELKKISPFKWHNKIPPNGISLGVADVDFQGPDGIIDYITQNLKESHCYYQNQSGMPIGIQAAKKYLIGKNIDVNDSNIQIIPGTMIGIYAAMKFISQYNGTISMIGPIYEPIHKHAAQCGNRINWIPIINGTFDEEALKLSISDNTKMISICSPTNPIGHVYNMNQLKVIRDLCVDYNLICFSDELYEPLTYNQENIPIASLDGMTERVISLYGFSKAYGLAGFRSGFMFLGDIITEKIKDIINLQLVSPSPIASIVCDYALNDLRAKEWRRKFKQKMKENTSFAAQLFRKNGINCNIPDSCFFVFPNIETDDIVFSEELLLHKGVQVIPGSSFGPMGQNHLRINCATSTEILEEGLSRIIDHLNL